MDKKDAKTSPGGATGAGPPKPQKPPNPIWRMMGLPNFRLKLPSRNWMIFLTVTGSWTAAVLYDRREKKRIQRKWTRLVEHIAHEPLPTQQMARKVTIYLSAPPADGLMPARDHFNEYVKPILLAAALDWDAVEGRREGDVRAGLAERIRRYRKRRGEPSGESLETDSQFILEETRMRSGVREWEGTAGDIVIGRHAWKEYVRGLHEGWLGSLDPPSQAERPPEVPLPSPPIRQDTPLPSKEVSADVASPTTEVDKLPAHESENAKAEENKPKKKTQPPPFITTADYSNAVLSSNCPIELPPSAAVPFPHLLGFLNFPIRMYRFLNRRQVADDIGRHTAAVVLALYRPFDGPTTASNSSVTDDSEGDSLQWEQQQLLKREESEWHKSARERKEHDDKERTWLDRMVLDPRIARRMRKFELDVETEERASKISTKPEESWWGSIWPRQEKKKAAWEGLNDDLD